MFDLPEKAVDKYRREGFVPTARATTQYIYNNGVLKIVGGIPIAKSLHMITDQYSLPSRLRRYDLERQYRHTARQYRLIGSHTGIPLKFDYRMPDEVYPSLDVLNVGDIGCGDGRFAVEFYHWHPEITYRGFDIVQERIEELNDRFEETGYLFDHANIYNGKFNPEGKQSVGDYDFPWGNDDFDLLIIHSVFTHMKPDGVHNYLSEIERVLADDGVAWTTWFILEDSHHRNAKGRSWSFGYDHGNYYSRILDPIEDKIGYQRSDVEAMIESAGLNIERSVDGFWKDPNLAQDAHRDVQDVLVLSTCS